MGKLEKVTRVERKHLISTTKKLELLEKLKEKLVFDEYSIEGRYSVRTLYFDTPDYQDYLDKINHAPVRKGIRMRIYSTNDTSAKIELKMKDQEIQNKISLKISKEDARQLQNGQYECLKNYDSEVAEKLYAIMTEHNYKPATLILYDRHAFKCPVTKLRVTMDSNLSTSNTEFDLWDGGIDTCTVGSLDEHVLEIKMINPLPEEIENIIYPLENDLTPGSKYKRCCRFLSF